MHYVFFVKIIPTIINIKPARRQFAGRLKVDVTAVFIEPTVLHISVGIIKFFIINFQPTVRFFKPLKQNIQIDITVYSVQSALIGILPYHIILNTVFGSKDLAGITVVFAVICNPSVINTKLWIIKIIIPIILICVDSGHIPVFYKGFHIYLSDCYQIAISAIRFYIYKYRICRFSIIFLQNAYDILSLNFCNINCFCGIEVISSVRYIVLV